MLALIIQKWSRGCANFRLLALGTLRFFRQLGFVTLNRPVSTSTWRCACVKPEPWEAQSREPLFLKWEMLCISPEIVAHNWPFPISNMKLEQGPCQNQLYPLIYKKISLLHLTSQPENQINTKAKQQQQQSYLTTPTEVGPCRHPH